MCMVCVHNLPLIVSCCFEKKEQKSKKNGKRGGATFQRCSGLENVAPESKNIAPALRESIQGHVL